MNYRIIALDLDHTLLNDDKRVSPQDASALNRAAAQGMYVVFASGRMSASIRQFSDALDIDAPIISYNGAMARDSRKNGDKVLLEIPLPAEYADELIDYTKKERFQLNYYLNETLYCRNDPELRRFAELYSGRTKSPFEFIPDLLQFKGNNPTKAIIMADASDPAKPNIRNRDEQYEFWQARWGGEVNIVCTDPEYLEFMNPQATKGAALEAIARHLGVSQDQVIAVGDGHNDTPMIEWAGLGVAVANAYPEVKAAAGYICQATHNDSPVSEVLARFAGI